MFGVLRDNVAWQRQRLPALADPSAKVPSVGTRKSLVLGKMGMVRTPPPGSRGFLTGGVQPAGCRRELAWKKTQDSGGGCYWLVAGPGQFPKKKKLKRRLARTDFQPKFGCKNIPEKNSKGQTFEPTLLKTIDTFFGTPNFLFCREIFIFVEIIPPFSLKCCPFSSLLFPMISPVNFVTHNFCPQRVGFPGIPAWQYMVQATGGTLHMRSAVELPTYTVVPRPEGRARGYAVRQDPMVRTKETPWGSDLKSHH